jgi:sulfotransferase family protein
VVINAVPKSGTHLAKKLVTMLGYTEHPLSVATETAAQAAFPFLPSLAPVLGPGLRVGATTPRLIHRVLLRQTLRGVPAGFVFQAHCGFSAELASLFSSEQIKVVCVIRDPRDIAVSLVHFLRQAGHKGFLALGEAEAQMRFAILGGTIATPDGRGTQSFQPLAKTCEEFWGWREQPDVLVTKFEDLVGAAGGGDDVVQAHEVERIAGHVAPHAELSGLRERLFGGTPTFYRGRIGSWREVLGASHRELLKTSGVGDYLIRAGYEANGNW